MKGSIFGWEITLRCRLHRGVGLGCDVWLRSWRDAYPWITGSFVVGPLFVSAEFVRPDAIALRMRAEREVA